MSRSVRRPAAGVVMWPRSELALASLLLLSAVVLALAWPFLAATADDAFITYAYARNLAEGKGLVFNVGERVEGFSSPLHVLVLAAAMRAGLPVVPTAKVIGLLALIAAAMGALWTVWMASRSFGLGLWAAAAIATQATLVLYAVQGLEDALYVALLVWGLGALAISAHRSVPTSAGPLLLGLAAIARPEGLMWWAVLAVFVAVNWRRQLSGAAGAASLLGLGLLVAWKAFTLHYYGALLPNTFRAKPGVGAGLAVFGLGAANPHAVAARYLLRLWRDVMPAMWLGLVAGLPLAPLARQARWLVAAACLLAVGFGVYAPHGWWFLQRYWQAAIALGYLTAALGLWGLWSAAGGRSGRRLAWAAAIALALGPLHNVTIWHQARKAWDAGQANPAAKSEAHIRLGKWLGEHAARTDWVVAPEIGAIKFYSRANVLDALGLTDRFIASLVWTKGGPGGVHRDPDAHRRWVEYVLRHRPAFVVVYVDRRSREPIDRTHRALVEVAEALGLKPLCQTRLSDSVDAVVMGRAAAAVPRAPVAKITSPD